MKHRASVSIALLTWFVLSPPAIAQDADRESVAEPVRSESGADPNRDPRAGGVKSDSEKAEKEKQQNAKIGMVFVAGIGFLGVFLIAVTLIYGRRLRRQLQRKRGPSQVRDELWYLKSKPGQSEREDSDA